MTKNKKGRIAMRPFLFKKTALAGKQFKEELHLQPEGLLLPELLPS